ncbi:glycosyltransferase [Desulfosporosinus sp. SB140]|uniref:glycosyltransferase n=1 Tax=Desulfosporosinus paludis TaxID=3115649 RepID=UPI00388E2447
MINVALVSHSPALTGAERMLFNLAMLLKSSNRHRPVMFIPVGPSKDLETICNDYKIKTVNLPEYVQYISATEYNSSQNAKKTLELYGELARILKKNDISLVVNNTATSIISALAGVQLQIPVVGWIHGILDSYMLAPEFDPERRLFFDRMFIALSDSIICCSDWTTSHYRQYNLSPVTTLHNWTTEPNLVKELDSQCKTFICLNTFDKYKGIFTLLEAATLLRRKHENFTVLLYGDGSMSIKKEINDFIVQNGLRNHIKMMGRTNDITAIFNNCLCLVQPSYVESFGMTIIEAMAHSRPSIAARSGGPKEIVLDNETGFLIQRNNPEELADKMAYFLDYPEKAKEYGIHGYRVYEEKFSSQRALREFTNVIDETLERYAGVKLEKQLHYDSLIRILEAEADSRAIETFTAVNKSCIIRSDKHIEYELLCYSKEISQSRKYNIFCEVKQMSGLGIIFASDFIGCSGTVQMNLYANARLLRHVAIPIELIVYQEWTIFGFQTVYNCGGKLLTVELDLKYSHKSHYIGVLEDTRNRPFIYKVFNRLGFPLKGTDALYVNCIE